MLHDTFDVRDIDEYLDDPFEPPSEPGMPIVIISHSEPKLFHCHYKVFPAYWRCSLCPPNHCFNRWGMRAMLDPERHYLPSCPRPNCSASATEETFLVNAQKENIMQASGVNLMESRAQDSYMWCCQCLGLRGDGAHRENDCAHCVNFKQRKCRGCVMCNKFLEPTRFCNGDMVYNAVLNLHARAV
ncbi:hypothetical protein C8A03DRAFT_13244, partial [Achaetomium macrosporum]